MRILDPHRHTDALTHRPSHKHRCTHSKQCLGSITLQVGAASPAHGGYACTVQGLVFACVTARTKQSIDAQVMLWPYLALQAA